MSSQLEETLTLNVGIRIARRLLTLCDDFGEEIEITQEQLATYVSAARESVNRHLRVWQRAGLIDIKRGRIIVLKPDALGVEAKIQADA